MGRFGLWFMLIIVAVATIRAATTGQSGKEAAAGAVKGALHSVKNLRTQAISLHNWASGLPLTGNASNQQAALKDCVKLQQQTLSLLQQSRDKLTGSSPLSSDDQFSVNTWVGAALTYETTCCDGINAFVASDSKMQEFYNKLTSTQKQLSNALSFINALRGNASP